MDAQLWTADPATLLRLTDVSPGRHASPVARANAAARFVVLWSVVATVASSLLSGGFRPHFLVVGAVLLAASGAEAGAAAAAAAVPTEQTARELKFCEAPSRDNPLANPKPTDFGKPGKLPACPSDGVDAQIRRSIDELPIAGLINAAGADPFQRRLADRSFYSLPATTVPNEVDGFRRAIAGAGVGRRMDHGFDQNIFSPR